jgi:hypothetical protein
MAEEGRLKLALERFVEATIPGIDYLAQYPGTITSQSGQLFDFTPDSPKVPGLQGLKFYSGSPGITFTVDTSANPRAVLFFEGGVPSGAALNCWGNPGLATLQIGGSGPAAARVGDLVTITVADIAALTLVAGPSKLPVTATTPIPAGTETSAISTGSKITQIA